jgi:hypothetical protein
VKFSLGPRLDEMATRSLRVLRALKAKLALFMRAQVAIVTEPRFEDTLADLRGVLADQRFSRDQIAEHAAVLSTLQAAEVEHAAELATLRAAVVEQIAELSTLRAAVVEQIAELSKLRALVEQTLRATENARRDMNETQRMVGVACARIENFIKIQKERSIAIEQSIASLHEERLRIAGTASYAAQR